MLKNKLRSLIVFIILIISLTTFVSANTKWTCLNRGQQISYFTCNSGCCVFCVKDTYPTAFYRCNDLPRCSCNSNVNAQPNDLEPPSLIVQEPQENDIFGNKRVNFDIKTNELSVIEYSDNNGKFSILCKSCSSYTKYKSFKDGQHNVKIRAVDIYGNTAEKEINFIVDTKKPKIMRTSPRNKEKTSNYKFSITYSEENLKEIKLFYRKEGEDEYSIIAKNDCLSTSRSIKRQTCEFDLTGLLSPGKYYFNVELTDGLHTTNLKKWISTTFT